MAVKKKTKTKKKVTGRPKPMVPKAELTKNKYACGGRIKNS